MYLYEPFYNIQSQPKTFNVRRFQPTHGQISTANRKIEIEKKLQMKVYLEKSSYVCLKWKAWFS